MNIGDRIKFSFAGEEREGMVLKIFPKKVYLKVDFPNHPGKILIRPLADLEGTKTVKRSKRREKAEKEKKAKQEKRERAQEKKAKEEEAEAEKE